LSARRVPTDSGVRELTVASAAVALAAAMTADATEAAMAAR